MVKRWKGRTVANGFIIFRTEFDKEYRTKYNLSTPDVSVVAAQLWKKLSMEEKAKYNNLSKKSYRKKGF